MGKYEEVIKRLEVVEQDMKEIKKGLQVLEDTKEPKFDKEEFLKVFKGLTSHSYPKEEQK